MAYVHDFLAATKAVDDCDRAGQAPRSPTWADSLRSAIQTAQTAADLVAGQDPDPPLHAPERQAFLDRWAKSKARWEKALLPPPVKPPPPT